jgi:hypothetical protein
VRESEREREREREREKEKEDIKYGSPVSFRKKHPLSPIFRGLRVVREVAVASAN